MYHYKQITHLNMRKKIRQSYNPVKWKSTLKALIGDYHSLKKVTGSS